MTYEQRASSRLPLIDRRELADETASLLDLTAPPGGLPPPTVAVLAHQPNLLAPFLGWAAALALNGALPKREHELLALRAAHRCHSGFEWAEHVEFARAAGLSDDEITGVADGPNAPVWPARESALLRAADELTSAYRVTDATWEVLAAHFPLAALVEIPFVVGQYAMLSMVANVMEIDAT